MSQQEPETPPDTTDASEHTTEQTPDANGHPENVPEIVLVHDETETLDALEDRIQSAGSISETALKTARQARARLDERADALEESITTLEKDLLDTIDDQSHDLADGLAEVAAQVERVTENQEVPVDPFSYQVLGPENDPDRQELAFRVRGSRPLGDPSPGLIEKVCEARLRIEENGKMPQSGYNKRIDHKYSTYDDVNGHVAAPLARAGIWKHSALVDSVRFTTNSTTKGGNPIYRVVAIMEVRITDGDSWIGRRVIGENRNAGDKHFYALESQLLRYALSKMLLLESGDPEVDQDDGASGTEESDGKPAWARDREEQETSEATDADDEDNEEEVQVEEPTEFQRDKLAMLREEIEELEIGEDAASLEDQQNTYASNALTDTPETKNEASAMMQRLTNLKKKGSLTNGGDDA